MESNIRIVLADDEELFRKGLSFLLQREPNITIVFEASDGSELLHYLSQATTLPDIILMDLKMPHLNGVEATRIIATDFPDIKVIALTSYHTKSFIANMLEIGAVAYLVKNSTPSQMLQTIHEVMDKGFFYNDRVLQVIHENILPNSKHAILWNTDEITKREREVLELICQQYSTQEIADTLFISKRTVEGHRNSLLLKTGSQNIAGLVVYAVQNKIVIIG